MGESSQKAVNGQIITSTTLVYVGLILVSTVLALASLVINPLYIVAGIIGIAAAILIYRHEYVGLILYLLLFLLRPAETYPSLAPLRLEFVYGGFLIVIVLLKNKWHYGNLRIPVNRLNYGYLLVLAAVALSVLGTACTSCTVDTFMTVAKLGVFYLLVILIIDSQRRLEIFMWIYILANIYMAAEIIQNFFSGVYVAKSGLVRATGGNSAVDNMNGIAITMNTIIPFIFYLMVSYRKLWKKVAMALMLAPAVLTLVLTGSRGGLLGFLTIMMIIWWRSRHKVLIGVLLVGFSLVGWFSMEESRRERYLTILDPPEQQDQSAQGRMKAWVDGMYLFAQKPITGVGAGAFAWARVEEFGVYLMPHNMYVQILAELGLIGAVFYALFLSDIFRTNRKISANVSARGYPSGLLEPMALAANTSCYSLLITGIFAHSAYRYCWFLFAALTVVAYRLHTESLSATEEPTVEMTPRDQDTSLAKGEA